MEYVEGRPLSEFLRDGGMAVETLLRYGRQISGALEHAHERGIVHRDLKPANVVVTPNGNAKILDFGLAKRNDPEQLHRKTTQGVATETSVGLTGTLPYMSPEQLEGKETGPRSDIWSLGVMLYEMASGTRPFRGDNLYRLCTAIIQEPLPPLPERVPAGIAAVIKRCLQKEPSRRYQRASELRAALEALEISGTAVAPPPPPPPARPGEDKDCAEATMVDCPGCGSRTARRREHRCAMAQPDGKWSRQGGHERSRKGTTGRVARQRRDGRGRQRVQ
jgi:serine/threonine-protein kinase